MPKQLVIKKLNIHIHPVDQGQKREEAHILELSSVGSFFSDIQAIEEIADKVPDRDDFYEMVASLVRGENQKDVESRLKTPEAKELLAQICSPAWQDAKSAEFAERFYRPNE